MKTKLKNVPPYIWLMSLVALMVVQFFQYSLTLRANEKVVSLNAKLQSLTKHLNQVEKQNAKLAEETRVARSPMSEAPTGGFRLPNGLADSSTPREIDVPPDSNQRIGRVGFRSAPAPTREERQKSNQDRLANQLEHIDKSYESIYNMIGIDGLGERQELLMLKAKQLEAERAAIQSAVSGNVGDREKRDKLITDARNELREAYYKDVDSRFGPEVANAIRVFEASQASASEMMNNGVSGPAFR